MYDSIKGSKILVTGCAGFIGSNLVEKLLELNCKVIGLDNLSNGFIENISEFLSNPNFSFIEGDIRDYNLCLKITLGVDYILHQAAWGSVPRSIKMPRLYDDINVKGSLNIFEAAKENSVKRVVYASSSSVYGDDPRLPKMVGFEGNVLSPYALTKKINEEYAKLYGDVYNLSTVGLRYFNVFGKKQNPDGEYAAVIPKFIKMITKGISPRINGDGSHSRDFTFIDNVVKANIHAISHNNAEKSIVLNVAGGDRISIQKLVEEINNITGNNIEPIFGDERPGDIKHSFADISLTNEVINYQVSVPFKKGLEMTIDWMKTYGI